MHRSLGNGRVAALALTLLRRELDPDAEVLVYFPTYILDEGPDLSTLLPRYL